MANSNAISAHGIIVKRNGISIAELHDVTPPALTRPSLEKTVASEDLDAFQLGRRVLGELSFTIGLVIGDATHLGLFQAYGNDSLDAYEIDFPDSATWFFDGYVVDLSEIEPVDGLLAVRVSVHLTGGITFSGAVVEDDLLTEDGDVLSQETGDALLLDA